MSAWGEYRASLTPCSLGFLHLHASFSSHTFKPQHASNIGFGTHRAFWKDEEGEVGGSAQLALILEDPRGECMELHMAGFAAQGE